jgi:hypothetical protein
MLVVQLPRAVEGARYRVQLARGAAFSELAFDEVIEGTELEVRHLYPDRYFLRAQVIESDGTATRAPSARRSGSTWCRRAGGRSSPFR